MRSNDTTNDPPHPAWYLVLIISAGLCSVAIAFFVEGGLGDVQQLQARKKALNESIESKRQTLLNLKEREKRLHQDPYLIEKLARKKLGYGRPGEKRVKLAGDGDTTPAKKSGNENVPEAWKSGE